MSGVTVSLVLVSHSGNLAKGVVEVASQMAPNVEILPAGGTEDDRIGTSYDRVRAMITKAAEGGRHVLVLSDLGSASMLAEMVIEEFDSGVEHVDVPFVEGAVAAAVAAQAGANLAGVISGAREAVLRFSSHPIDPAQEAEPAEEEGITQKLTLRNKLGLHARPAAMVARMVAEYDVKVTVNGTDAASVLALMALALPGGAEVELRATGPDASAAMMALVPQFEEGFGEE